MIVPSVAKPSRMIIDIGRETAVAPLKVQATALQLSVTQHVVQQSLKYKQHQISINMLS